MQTTISKSLSEVIKERRSVRKYDSTCKISHEEINDMLKEAIQAPPLVIYNLGVLLSFKTKRLKRNLERWLTIKNRWKLHLR